MLYYRWIDNTIPTGKQLTVAPKSLREKILHLNHDIKLAGHLCQSKTMLRVRQSFFWYGMKQDCIRFVSSCSTCNKSKKANRKAKAELGSYHAGIPMERVHLDILGPFMKSENRNRYVLVMIDQFTKWLEVQALPTQTAEVVAEAAVNGFFSRMGCALNIHTDQGKNFDGQVFKAVCDLLEMAKTRTTPYRPSANGQVERYNRMLLSMIRSYLDKNLRSWDSNLQLLAGAIRATVNRSTGFTPNMMMLGREVLMPVDIMLGTREPKGESKAPQEYIIELEASMTEAHRLARENLLQSQRRQKRDYDVRINRSKYEAGDLVYKLDDSTQIGVSKKLKSPWIGPLLVIAVLSPVLYRVKGFRNEEVLHHDKLKLCGDRLIPMWVRRMRQRFLQGLNDTQPNHTARDDDLCDESLEQLFDEQSYGENSNSEADFSAQETTEQDVPVEGDGQEDEKSVQEPKEVKTRRGRHVKLPQKYLE